MDMVLNPISERRDGPRQRVLKGAKLSFNNGYGALEGIVRNASDGGVKIELGDTFAVPGVFDLQISGEDGRHKARVCWRNTREIGVALD